MKRSPSRTPQKVRLALTGLIVAVVAALTPSALAHAATSTIYFEGNISSGSWKSSSFQYYLDGGRAWVIGQFDTPRVRTVNVHGKTIATATGTFGGAIDLTHARTTNAKSSCNFLPYSGLATTTKMICKYVK